MPRSRTTARLLAVTALAATAVTGPLAIEASAAPAAPTSCAYGVAATRTADPHAQVKKTCFATFAEALGFATRGRVSVARSAATVSSATLIAGGAIGPDAAQPLLGIEYFDSSYGGSSDVYYGTTGSGCSSGAVYGFPVVRHNDTYSSSAGYSSCGGDHYENGSYGGADLQCNNNCSNLGLLNDRTSSIVYR